MNRGNLATGLKVKSNVGHSFDLCHIYRRCVWEEVKLPVSVQVYSSHDVTQMTNVNLM